MATPACYDDGSSTESEYYFDPEDAEANEPLGGGDAAAPVEEKQQGVSSTGTAAFPSLSVTDGAKCPGGKSSVDSVDAGASSVRTATVTDSDSSVEGEKGPSSKKPRTGEKERPTVAENTAKVAVADAKRQENRVAPRIVRLARPKADRATGTASTSSTIRKLSGSLRQLLPVISTDVDPLLGKIEQGLSNPRPGSKRSLPSSVESSPRHQETKSKRQRREVDSATNDSSRVVRLSRSESKRGSHSRDQQRSEEKRSHSREDASRASRGEEASQASRSSDRRVDELPPRKSSSSRRSLSEHRSQRSDQDRPSSTGSSTSTSKCSYYDRAQSDSHRSSSRHSGKERSDARPNSSDYSKTCDPRRSSSHHPGVRNGDDARPISSDYSKTRDPRRSSSSHPEGRTGDERRSDARPSSSEYSVSRDPRRTSSHQPEARIRDEKGSHARPSSSEYSNSRDPRWTSSHYPEGRDGNKSRIAADYSNTRDRGRSSSHHPEGREGEEKRSRARSSSSDYNNSRDLRRSLSDHRNRDPRQRSNEQRSDYCQSPSRLREEERIEDPGRGVDEYENKRERPEFYQSSSQHPEFSYDAARGPPSRGYDSSQSQQYRETHDRYAYHLPNQHKQPYIRHSAAPTHRDEFYFERRDGREYAPRQDYPRSHPPDHFEPVEPVGRPESTLQSPREFVQCRPLEMRLRNLHQERRRDASYEYQDDQPLPPVQQPFNPPPGYYLSEQRIESPRSEAVNQAPVNQVGTWQDPRRNPRAREGPRVQAASSASNCHPAHSQPLPAQHRQELGAQGQFNSCPPSVQGDQLQRSRSVDPRREGDNRHFSEQTREDRARDSGFTGSLAQGSASSSRREYAAPVVHASPAARNPRQFNANGKRSRSEIASAEAHPSRTIAALLAAGKIDRKYEMAVSRFKLSSRFAEMELQNPNSVHKRSYLLEFQNNLRQIKIRLERQHPNEFADVFDAVTYTQEQIRRFGERKSFSQRMQNFLREQQKVDGVASGKNAYRINVEWRQRQVDEEREKLVRENPDMFDRMLKQWDPKMGRCRFSKSFHEEWGDV